jgi:hypothetical protein
VGVAAKGARRGRARVALACAVALLATLLPAPAGAGSVASETTLAVLRPVTPTRPDLNATLVRDALNTAGKYYLNSWWAERMTGFEPWSSWSQRAALTTTLDAEDVRRYSSVALAVAAPLATGAYDARVTKVDEETARQRVAELVALSVRTHIANVPARAAWGASWQSALWASQVALAGWLIGPALPEHDRLLLGRMLAHEADVVTARPLHYLRDRAGALLTPGDSGAEELAWDGLGALTAVELLPYHPRRQVWAEAAYERFVAAYSLPSDVHSGKVVNGRRVSTWLDGSNAERDGWVVNHHRVNPDYTVGFSPHAAVVPALAGAAYPEAIRHNQALLYRNVSRTPFASPPALAPGGSVYVRGTPRLYFPEGPDWGTGRQFVFGALDVEADVHGFDRGLTVSARRWGLLHLRQVRRMQHRSRTGQMFQAAAENRYFAREEHAGAVLAYAHLTTALAAAGRLRVDRGGPSLKRPLP